MRSRRNGARAAAGIKRGPKGLREAGGFREEFAKGVDSDAFEALVLYNVMRCPLFADAALETEGPVDDAMERESMAAAANAGDAESFRAAFASSSPRFARVSARLAGSSTDAAFVMARDGGGKAEVSVTASGGATREQLEAIAMAARTSAEAAARGEGAAWK